MYEFLNTYERRKYSYSLTVNCKRREILHIIVDYAFALLHCIRPLQYYNSWAYDVINNKLFVVLWAFWSAQRRYTSLQDNKTREMYPLHIEIRYMYSVHIYKFATYHRNWNGSDRGSFRWVIVRHTQYQIM